MLKEVSRLPSSWTTFLWTSDTRDTAEAFTSKPKTHLVVYSLNHPGLDATVSPSGRLVSVNVISLSTVIAVLNESVEPG